MSSLSKAASILTCFATEQTDLSVGSVAARLGLPKSSVSRMMSEMATLGLLQRNATTRAYAPGYLLFQLGSIYQAHFDVIEIVDRLVRDLVQETGCTGYIGLLTDGEIVALRKHPGREAVGYRLQVGKRYAPTYLSFGKALLARRSDAEIWGFFTRYPDDQPADMDAFFAEIAEIRGQGWAYATRTSVPGVHGIGVAVVSPLSDQLIGYSLSYHAALMGEAEIRHIASRLVASARNAAALTRDAYWLHY